MLPFYFASAKVAFAATGIKLLAGYFLQHVHKKRIENNTNHRMSSLGRGPGNQASGIKYGSPGHSCDAVMRPARPERKIKEIRYQ
jgi:hypothetical protein